MQQGTIVALHIARVKETPSEPVKEATAISAAGLDGDRSCNPDNTRQVLIMDKETLDKLGLEPGQIKENITTTNLDLSNVQNGNVFFIGDNVTMEAVGDCEPCGKMDAIRPGLREELDGQRGILTVVINGGDINIGDSIRIEP